MGRAPALGVRCKSSSMSPDRLYRVRAEDLPMKPPAARSVCSTLPRSTTAHVLDLAAFVFRSGVRLRLWTTACAQALALLVLVPGGARALDVSFSCSTSTLAYADAWHSGAQGIDGISSPSCDGSLGPIFADDEYGNAGAGFNFLPEEEFHSTQVTTRAWNVINGGLEITLSSTSTAYGAARFVGTYGQMTARGGGQSNTTTVIVVNELIAYTLSVSGVGLVEQIHPNGAYSQAQSNVDFWQGGVGYIWQAPPGGGVISGILQPGQYAIYGSDNAFAQPNACDPASTTQVCYSAQTMEATSQHAFVLSLTPIPEPGTGLLVMTGLLVLVDWRRRRA